MEFLVRKEMRSLVEQYELDKVENDARKKQIKMLSSQMETLQVSHLQTVEKANQNDNKLVELYLELKKIQNKA